MPLDTNDFDAKIADLNNQILVAQKDLDADAFQLQLRATQAKADNIRVLTANLTDIQEKKSNAINIQASIDSKAQDLAMATQSLADLRDSIK